MRNPIRFAFTLALLLAACRVSVDTIPPGAQFLCQSATDCPDGWSCDLSVTLDGGGHLCVGSNSQAGPNGAKCSAAADCKSGFCTDGVCCESKCDGLCMACDVAGSEGTCSPVPAGTDPANECATTHNSVCAATCNGAGACAAPAPGSTCGTCRACGSDGTCGADCGNFACLGDGGCATGCTSSADCASFAQCVNGVCQRQVGLGAACDDDGSCQSGHCVHATDGGAGVCCAEDCRTDTSACGYTGACDLSDGGARFGHCEFQPAGHPCAPASCSSSAFTLAQTCPGGGAGCPQPAPQPCPNGETCANSQICQGSCVPGTQTGCTGSGWCHAAGDGGTYCVAGAQQNGEACGTNTDCSSAHCDHQICCTSGNCCDGTTTACPSASCQVATCSGTSYACSSFSCVANNDPSACSGTVSSSCGTFRDAVCGSTGTTCPTTCLNASSQPDDTLCDPGTFCNAEDGHCYAPLPDGNALSDGGSVRCQRSAQCQSGFCDSNSMRPDYSYPSYLCCQDTGTHQCCSGVANCGDSVGNGSTTQAYTSCSQPSQCHGTRVAATCTNFACSANGTSTEDDSKCWSQLDANDYYNCGSNLIVKCNGSSSQNPAASCPSSCGANCNNFGCFCSGNNNVCKPGTTCQNAGGTYPSCTGSCQ